MKGTISPTCAESAIKPQIINQSVIEYFTIEYLVGVLMWCLFYRRASSMSTEMQ